jgi:hypothetical protein
MGLIWAFGSAPRLVYIFYFNSALFWAARFILRLSYIRCKAQIHFTFLFKAATYFHRSISPRFTYAHQYPCYCDLLTLWSMETSRFTPLVAPAVEVASFRSDSSSGVVSPWEVVPWCPINDLCGESHCIPIPDESIWYQSVPNLNSYKFNEINQCFVQLNALFASFMYVSTN